MREFAVSVLLPLFFVVERAEDGRGAAGRRHCMVVGGVTELVVLNVGLGLGVIGAELFTALVLMALVTTAVTGPVVRALREREAKGAVGLRR